ncbi:hypothetical protein SAMN03003324_02732 [Pedobacter antarcticus]|uniref:Uncharacterized protein n=1 Tax=Pedobacter antarcticus TaxID=34086 RepID=A0A1I2GLN8_9SPHI|nr:hypothetical protein SAMN03003324_02732 [Pedobacter antarcticus]
MIQSSKLLFNIQPKHIQFLGFSIKKKTLAGLRNFEIRYLISFQEYLSLTAIIGNSIQRSALPIE